MLHFEFSVFFNPLNGLSVFFEVLVFSVCVTKGKVLCFWVCSELYNNSLKFSLFIDFKKKININYKHSIIHPKSWASNSITLKTKWRFQYKKVHPKCIKSLQPPKIHPIFLKIKLSKLHPKRNKTQKFIDFPKILLSYSTKIWTMHKLLAYNNLKCIHVLYLNAFLVVLNVFDVTIIFLDS